MSAGRLSSGEKFSLFACLYFAQGLPYGFFTQAMPVYLREANASLAAIGGAALLTWPWALKFLWAPLADRYGWPRLGLRRSWILPLQTISILSLVAVSFLDPKDSLFVVLLAFLVCNLVAATQDAATDGLAVDLLAKNERGWANGIQVGGYRVGMIVGGAVMLNLLSMWGWQAAMLTMALTLAIVTLPAFTFNENEALGPLKDRVDARLERHPIRDLKEFVFQPNIFTWLFILLIYKFSHQAASAMMKPWLVDNGYRLDEIGALIGLFGSGAGLIGALVGGWIASRFSRMKSLIYLALAQAIATGTYLLPVLTAPAAWKVALATSIDNGISGMATVTLFAAMMDRCRKGHSASDYAIQASFVVISQTLASSLSGVSAEYFGYKMHFLGIGILGFAVTILVWRVLSPMISKTAAAVTVIVSLFSGIGLFAGEARAQSEVGIGFGPLLPSRIPKVREIQNTWGVRYGTQTAKGFFEIDWAHGRNDGIVYNAFGLDYRLAMNSEDDQAADLPVHFLLGFHIDHFKGLEEEAFRTSGGWHYGGGLRLPIGGPDSPFMFRTDFRHRFSPGSSLIVLVGFSFKTGTSDTASEPSTP
ncbi:MAG: MFS transporter [Bdellovibrionales bacterium]|nr:MFS transporter [Bdellovibrionales bacterium]